MSDGKELDVRRQEARLNQNIDKMFYQACELFQAQIKAPKTTGVLPWHLTESYQNKECNSMVKFLSTLYSACSAEVTSHAD